MTHQKIAKLAGVSPSTVSKALAGSKEVSPEKTELIQKIAADYGYYEEKRKRKQEASRNYTPRIAILCPEIIGRSYALSASFLIKEFEERGCLPSIFLTGFLPSQEQALLQRVSKEADGIVSHGKIPCEEPLAQPLVYLSDIGASRHFDSVYENLEDGMQQAICHLVKLGHRSIGFIGEPNTHQKRLLFEKLLPQNGLCVRQDHIYTITDRFEEAGYAAAQQILQQEDRPTAFLTGYDEIALGAIELLKNRGYQIPLDFSFIGINDAPFSSFSKPGLTSIHTNQEAQCALAAQILWQKITQKDFTMVQHVATECELIVRQSTAPPSLE